MAHVGKLVAIAQDAKFKTRTKIGAPEFAQHTTYDIVLGFPNQESTMTPLDFLCPSLFQSLGLVPPSATAARSPAYVWASSRLH